MSRDRNLLFGILALQLKQVTTEALVQAAKQWATDPSCDIADILQEAGTLTSNSRTFVDEVVNRLIEGHGDDSTLTLNAFGGEEQVYVTYQGTITLTPSGGVSTVTIPFQEDGQQGGHIPGVQETPGRYTHISEYGTRRHGARAVGPRRALGKRHRSRNSCHTPRRALRQEPALYDWRSPYSPVPPGSAHHRPTRTSRHRAGVRTGLSPGRHPLPR